VIFFVFILLNVLIGYNLPYVFYFDMIQQKSKLQSEKRNAPNLQNETLQKKIILYFFPVRKIADFFLPFRAFLDSGFGTNKKRLLKAF